MAVISRSPSLILTDQATAVGITSEYLPEGMPRLRFENEVGQLIGSTNTVYGAGHKVLVSFEATMKQVSSPFPVFQRVRPGRDSTNIYAAIESAFYPSLYMDPKTQEYHLLYWVNGWSPPAPESYVFQTEPSLFPSLDPPRGTEDLTYRYGVVEQPPIDIFEPKDLPEWNFSINPVHGVGPFDQHRFWIAPITDAHMYRYADDFTAVAGDATPDQNLNPNQTPGISDVLPGAGLPSYRIISILAEALRAETANQPLTEVQEKTLELYRKMPTRLINLARTTRVLLYSRGVRQPLYVRKQPDLKMRTGANTATNADQTTPYTVLLFDAPKAIQAFPQSTNKVMCHRQKYTTFLPGGTVFITAPINYQYPGAGSATLTTTEPIVDFTLHDPSQTFDGWNLGGLLPVATDNQTPPWAGNSSEFSIAAGLGNNLAGILSTPNNFASF